MQRLLVISLSRNERELRGLTTSKREGMEPGLSPTPKSSSHYTESALIKCTYYEITFRNTKDGEETAEVKKSCNISTETGRKMRQ